MMSMLLQHTGPRGHRRRYGNGKIRASIRNATVIPLKARLVTPALHALAQAQFGRNSSRFGRNVRALPENEALAWSRPSPGRLGPLPGLRALSGIGHRRCMQPRCLWPHWSGGPGRSPQNSRDAASRAWSPTVAPPASSPGPFRPATPL